MSGAVVMWVFLIALIGYVLYTFFKFDRDLKKQRAVMSEVDSNSEYCLERSLKAQVMETSFEGPMTYESTRLKCLSFIESGAFMVCTHSFPNGRSVLYVHTSKAILGNIAGREVVYPLFRFTIMQLAEQYTQVSTPSKKSVAGSAAVGAVIGGAAGAVVGAAYAAEKNANAKPTSTTKFGAPYYFIAIDDPVNNVSLSHIMISKKASPSNPPTSFVKYETDEYWIVHTPKCYKKSELEGLLYYLNSVLNSQDTSV